MSKKLSSTLIRITILVVIVAFLAAPNQSAAQSSCDQRASTTACPPLPPPTGTVVQVDNESELRNLAENAAENTTILVSANTYAMQDYVRVVSDGIAIRGATGNRDDVILDFGGMVGGHFGILVEGDDATIADLTIRNASDHGVSIQGRDRPILYNLHIQDIGDQLVKVNPWGDGS